MISQLKNQTITIIVELYNTEFITGHRVTIERRTNDQLDLAF